MNKKQIFYALAAGLAGVLPADRAAASGKIYTCEAGGVTVYTSRPSGSCRSADLPNIGRYTSSRYDAPQVSARVQPRTPSEKTVRKSRPAAQTRPPVSPVRAAEAAYGPKPSAGNSRRAILETELANERRALSEAQKSLAQARAAKSGMIDRQQINQLEGTVLDRRQNIQALQRELGRM